MTKQFEFEPETAITVQQPAALEVQQPLVVEGSPLMQIIARAVDRGANIETVKALRDLLCQTEADESKKKFDQAYAAFKGEAIVIIRDKENTQYSKVDKKSHQMVMFHSTDFQLNLNTIMTFDYEMYLYLR